MLSYLLKALILNHTHKKYSMLHISVAKSLDSSFKVKIRDTILDWHFDCTSVQIVYPGFYYSVGLKIKTPCQFVKEKLLVSLRRKPTLFAIPPLYFSAKWHLRNKCRNFILMMHQYQDLGNASDGNNQSEPASRYE